MPSKKKLLVTFDVELSPVKVHTVFPIHITISNLSSTQVRDISIEVPLVELDKDLDRFVRTPKSSPSPILGSQTGLGSVSTASSRVRIPEITSTSELPSMSSTSSFPTTGNTGIDGSDTAGKPSEMPSRSSFALSAPSIATPREVSTELPSMFGIFFGSFLT